MSASRPQPTLRSLQIISAAMPAAVLLFLAVTLFVRQGIASAQLDLVSYLAAGWGVLSLPVASVLRSAKWPSTTPDQDPDYWRRRGAAHIVSIGILEGAALFCCIALIVARPLWPLFAMLVPMGGMVAWFPRAE